MKPEIRELAEKKLVGKYLRMSMAANRTFELWKSFMPERKMIANTLNTDMLSVQVYDASYDHTTFNPDAVLDKWAAVEVTSFDSVPEGMSSFLLPGGTYALFRYRGPASDGAKIFGYIFGTWLSSSGYVVDHRPHFELLGAKYSNTAADSEEEIWIPVKLNPK